MNEHAQAWVDALRSGDFAQTTGRLLKVDADGSRSYCCWGVACTLAGFEAFHDVEWCFNLEDGTGPHSGSVVGTWLPLLLNLSDADARELEELNDGGHTFTDIADVIERWQS